MNFNPYEPPRPGALSNAYPQPPLPPVNRTPFIVAAIGAWCASGYWALMLLLGFIGVVIGGRAAAGLTLVVPVLLIALYASRGLRIFRGDLNALRRILWLHGFGAVSAFLQAQQSQGLGTSLQGLKVVINLCGLAAALWALRALQRAPAPQVMGPSGYGAPPP